MMTLLNLNYSENNERIEEYSSLFSDRSEVLVKKGLSVIMESPEKRNGDQSHINEISDEAQHEISMAIHASARQSIRPYNTQVSRLLFPIKFPPFDSDRPRNQYS